MDGSHYPNYRRTGSHCQHSSLSFYIVITLMNDRVYSMSTIAINFIVYSTINVIIIIINGTHALL